MMRRQLQFRWFTRINTDQDSRDEKKSAPSVRIADLQKQHQLQKRRTGVSDLHHPHNSYSVFMKVTRSAFCSADSSMLKRWS